jgi:DNA invertase Pin-like site-specific DNA recombinase
MRAALYARYSTDRQREESIDDQFREGERVARAQGMEVVARFKDEGISGGTAHREGYQALLGAARRKDFDVVIAEDLSRLWRSRAEYGLRSAELEDLGIHIVTAVGDDTRRDGFLVLTIKQGIAEHQRREIAYRTRRGMEGLALAGKSTGGRAYGYASQWEAATVREIFARAAAGESPASIAEELNARHEPAPRGRHWYPVAVKRILANARYAGRLVWGATVSTGGARDSRSKRHVSRPEGPLVTREIPALVTPEIWESVNLRGAVA